MLYFETGNKELLLNFLQAPLEEIQSKRIPPFLPKVIQPGSFIECVHEVLENPQVCLTQRTGERGTKAGEIDWREEGDG